MAKTAVGVAAAALAALYVYKRRLRQRPTTPKPREPPSWPKVPLKLSENANELFSVCRLRYQVYVGELKRQNYSYVDDIEQVIEDPCDAEEGVQNWFVAHPEPSEWEAFVRKAAAPPATPPPPGHGIAPMLSDVAEEPIDFVPAVGCVRLHVPVPPKYRDMFSTEDAAIWGAFASTPTAFCFFSRFMVHAAFRGRTLGYADALYACAAREARRAGARFLLLNCTPALAPMYEAKGFVRYKPCVWDGGMGLQVPMALVLDDLPSLVAADRTSAMAAALRASASELPSFPDAAAVAWLAALAARRPAVLIRHAEYDAFRSFLAECGMARDKPLGFYAGLTPAEEAELYAKVPSAFGVLDVPAGCMLSRAGDVRDESFLVLRGAVVVDGLETVGLGGMIGESAFLSGQKRACDIRCKASSAADLAGPADEHTSVLLLVVSRIGFQKAMKVAPEVAVKFLWNVAHELSVRFTARNELFKATALELKASKASADFEVSKLLKLVAKPPAARRGAERAGATFEEVSSKGSMALRRLRQHSRANLGLGISGGIRPGNKLAESAAVLPNKVAESESTLNIRPGKKLGESADF